MTWGPWQSSAIGSGRLTQDGRIDFLPQLPVNHGCYCEQRLALLAQKHRALNCRRRTHETWSSWSSLLTMASRILANFAVACSLEARGIRRSSLNILEGGGVVECPSRNEAVKSRAHTFVVAGRGVPKHWGPNQAVGESRGSGCAEGHAA